jgi:uncharacterized protein YaiE (UPF0345 family)
MATSITNTSITTNDLIVDSADNLLKVDHATNRVGVGTSSPSNLLTLKADSTEETMLVFQNDSAVAIGAVSIHPSNGLVLSQSVAGSSVHVMTHDGNEDINLDSDGFIQIEVAGSELMRLNSTGVGIDTDNPLSIFHVGSGSDANVPITLAPATGGNIEFRNTSSTGTFTFTNANGSNEHIRIDSSGNVGIGTDSPRSELSIAANNSGQGAKLTLENTDTSITTNDVIGQIDFYANDSSTNGTGAKVNIKAIATSGAGTVTALTLGVSDSASATAAEIMRLKSTEVGWSNTTNGFYNKIYGPTSGDIASGYLTYNGSTLRGGFYTNPTHGLTVISEVDMSFRANNANRMHINTDGIVTTPNQPSFQASKSGSSWTVTAGSIFIFNNTEHNIGGHYNTSNGRFTAPVAGTYQFSFHTIYTGNSGNDWISIRRNGARISGGDYHFSTTPGGQWDTIGGSLNLYLSSGDYVSMYAGTEHVYHGGTWSNFGGHLVG